MDPLALQRIPARQEAVAGWAGPTLALLGASTAGIVAQGGFYLPGRLLVAGLAMVSFVLALRDRRGDDRALLGFGGAAAAIAAWALLRAATAGGWVTAAGIGLTLATVLAALHAARRARPADLATGLVLLGTLVGLTAWAGVAWRIGRWSVLVESTLWRGASTLTYPNAAAAILAVCALVALARVLAGPRALLQSLMVYLVLAGLAATLSRAGAIAFAAGVVVFAVLGPRRGLLRHLGPAGLGAAVALAGLAPSFAVAAEPRPLLAVGALLAGGLIAVLLPTLSGARLAAAWALLLAAAGALAVVAGGARPGWLDALLHRRLTLASQGRSGALRSALDRIAAHPLLGGGPGRARFFWVDVHGELVASRWVHNEYVQWLADLGLVGLGLLLVLGVTAARLLWRARPAAPGTAPLWTGAVAAIAALAVHSAFDFLWELAVVPLVFGLLIGVAAPSRSEEPSAPSSNGEETQ